MITIYTTEYTTHQPLDIPTQDIEDGREREIAISFIRWLGVEIADLFRSPVQLAVFYTLIFWPVILYG